jgi:hypothetical protein
MNDGFSSLGKALIGIGLFVIFIGIILLFSPKIPFIGKLPGDIFYKRGNFSIYFSLATCILISVALTLIFYFINKIRH